MLHGLRVADGFRVLVTAGAGGIGRVIVEAMIEAGAKVHLCDVDDAALAACREALPQVGVARADVASEADVDRLFDEAKKSWAGSTR